jgi:hypothetical protein
MEAKDRVSMGHPHGSAGSEQLDDCHLERVCAVHGRLADDHIRRIDGNRAGVHPAEYDDSDGHDHHRSLPDDEHDRHGADHPGSDHGRPGRPPPPPRQPSDVRTDGRGPSNRVGIRRESYRLPDHPFRGGPLRGGAGAASAPWPGSDGPGHDCSDRCVWLVCRRAVLLVRAASPRRRPAPIGRVLNAAGLAVPPLPRWWSRRSRPTRPVTRPAPQSVDAHLSGGGAALTTSQR